MAETEKIVIGRNINHTTLNPLEFLLDSPDGDYWLFDDKPAAYAFIRDQMFPDSTEEEIEDAFTFMTRAEAEAYVNKNEDKINKLFEEVAE